MYGVCQLRRHFDGHRPSGGVSLPVGQGEGLHGRQLHHSSADHSDAQADPHAETRGQDGDDGRHEDRLHAARHLRRNYAVPLRSAQNI